jgi:serine/threonine protein kinase
VVGNTVELTDEGAPRFFDGPDPLIGRTLRHYEVKERIGQGGMSVVYRGRDHRLHRDVAIKVLHPFLAEKPECRHRLAREARAVARLEHDNILRIFDYSGDPPTLNERPTGSRQETDREGFLVTELVQGETLKRFSDTHQIWNVPEVGALITWQLACALAHAHANGVIHRDIKPENVMVRRDGVLKLMDFGIAQVVDSKSLTVTGTLLGSPAHMAPECIESFPADEQSDVFSLGTVLYWLTTGCLPFEALTPHALLKAIVDGRYAPPQQKNPRVSDAITRVLIRALATDRANRYLTAQQMADDLRDLLVECGVVVSAVALESTLGDPDTNMPRLDAEVRVASLALSQRLLDEDMPARALGVLSRVLAAHPGDPEALALLERAQLGADEASTLDDIVNDETDDQDESPVLVGPASVATSRREPATKRAMLLVGLAVLLVGVAGVSRVVDRPAALAKDETNVVQETTESGMSFVDPAGGDVRKPPLPDALGADRPAVTPKGGADRPREAGPALVQVPGTLGNTNMRKAHLARLQEEPPTAPPIVVASAPASDLTESRRVDVRVYPPAKVEIDGGETVDVFREASIALTPGRHTLRFTNPAAVTEERVVEIPPAGHVAAVIVQLEPAPALVEVDTKGVDATVAIRPTNGSAGDKIIPAPHDGRRPVPVFFAKDENGRFIGVLEYEVTATAPGRRPLTKIVKLEAGKTLRLSLVLEDAQNAERGDATSAPATP